MHISLTRFKKPHLFLFIFLCICGATIVIASIYFSNLSLNKSSATKSEKLDRDIQTAEVQIEQKPVVTKPYLNLASLYLQKVRETSNSSYYIKIDALMNLASEVDPHDGDVPAIRASVAMGRHDFQKGKKFIQQALAINSAPATYYGLNGDADIELGQYSDAVVSFQKMINIRPDFSSWSRIAYIRELYGDIDGAKVALNQAIDSGSNYPENSAWAYVERGKLEMRDDLTAASMSFTHALQELPTYTQAMEGLGKVAFFNGNLREAERQFSAAYNGRALAQYAIDLGDLYEYEKNTVKAQQEYALAEVAFHTSLRSGINTDLEESLFLSDHDIRLTDALEMATRAYTARPSEYGADYLSWALYKNGKINEALSYTKEALQLGEVDPLILYHQGMVALAHKDNAHAKLYLSKAYSINPNFSIQYSDTLKSSLASPTTIKANQMPTHPDQ